jgi:hypothetical protein
MTTFTMKLELPFCSLDTVCAISGFWKSKVEDLLESGALYPAFNLSPKKNACRLVRVATQSVTRLVDRTGPELLDAPALLEKVFRPGTNPRAEWVARLFCLKSDTVIELLKRKLIVPVRGTVWRRGPNGSPMMQRDSLVRFLLSREIR